MAIKWIKGTAGLLVGALTALTLLQLLLHILPVSKGEYGAEPDPNWPAQHLIPNSGFTSSAGWDLENARRGHINNMGYVAPFDYQFGTEGVFVVGDSFIVNMMNSYSDGLQGSLPVMLAEKTPVLGFGTIGGNLAQDLGVAALIGAHFRPNWGVVLVTRGNFVNGFSFTPGYFRWASVPRPDVQLSPPRRHGLLARFVRDLALVQYVRSNLRADVSRLLADRGSQITGGCAPPQTLSVTDKALVHLIVEQLPVRFGLPPSQVILVFDADREAIYKPEMAQSSELCSTRDSLARRLLAEEAANYGIEVINMEPVFRTHFLETGEHFDYLPVDGHWNGVAHRLAAKEVARYINTYYRASLH